MLKLFKTKASNESINAKELNTSHYIPYKCHWNRNTILTKQNALLKVIKVGGYSFETADDEDLDIQKNMRNLLFKGMASGEIKLYFHTIRRRKPLGDDNVFKSDPSIQRKQDFVSYLNSVWTEKYKTFESFINELYITILYQPDTKGVAALEHWYKKLRQTSAKDAWDQDMRELHEKLDEMTQRVMGTFNKYDAEVLSVVERQGCTYCEILEFLGTIVNCGESSPMLLPRQNIDEYIGQNRLFFGSRSLESRSPRKTKYAAMLSILEYGPTTTAGFFDSFLQMPFEFIMTQSFSFANRTVAINQMQLQQNRMIQAEDKAVSQIAEISEALDMAMSGDIGFGDHHFTLLCMDKDEKSLENTIAQAMVEISNTGLQPVRERVNLEPSYWGQLPGNRDFIIRKSTINTLNLSGFVSMHNYPTGKARGNHWGDHVTVLDTTSGTPYYFSFHVRDVGHTLIIGPTGAGKTVLMNFLCAQAQKFKCRMYFFDKDRGAEIFIRALDGEYTVVNPGASCNFNPLQLPDTSENRTFLLDWLKLLVTVNGETLGADDIKLLNAAINGNYKLDFKDRKLSNVAPFLGIEGPGSLAGRIAMWIGNGSHAKVFDNDRDSIDLEKASVFGFEMADLLKDTISLGPVLLYIFHRINISLDGSPTMIVLDEAWALIDNPIFAPKIKDWLKVLRKLNAFVIFATQSVEDASKSTISDTLVQQTATQIFLPNLKATDVYKTAFMLSQREYSLIKSTDPSSRYFLVKQGVNAVIARVNLSGMDNIINVLSGRAETVVIVDELIAKYGPDPVKWLPEFYQRCKKLDS